MFPFRSPFTAVVSGPTQCGKSALVLRIIDNADSMIVPPPQRILYCYGEYQASFDAFREKVEFVEGLPSPERFDGRLHTLLVLDDLMAEADESVANIFTKISHHRNVSVFFLTQNLFHKNKHMRTMSLNAHYLILFKNPRDVTQFATLARQMYSTNWRFALDAFNDATSEAHSYLLVDLKTETENAYRLRTNIFPGEQTYVYVNKR
jgi:hypothetical protein